MNECKPLALGYYAAVVWSMQKLYASPDLFATKVRWCRLTLSNPR